MTVFRICCIIGIGALALSAAQGLAQEDMRFVDNTVFDRPLREPSVFEHDAHNEAADLEDCTVCHHLYDNGKLVEDESSEDQSCSECHALDGSGDNPSLRRAYHLSCKGCHVQQSAGPIMCAQCHRTLPADEPSAK